MVSTYPLGHKNLTQTSEVLFSSLKCENVGKIQISMQKLLIKAILLYDYSKMVYKSSLRHYFELDLTSLDFRGLRHLPMSLLIGLIAFLSKSRQFRA